MLLSVVVAVIVVLVAEWLWLKNRLKSEATRKLIHVMHGVVIATWPFFTSYQWIILAELAFIAIVAFDHKFHIIQGAKDVSRITWGEFMYPLGIIAVALMQPNHWIFVAAILHLALADAAAALIGTRAKAKLRYRVFGQRKSLTGSLAFLVISVLITTVIVYGTPAGLDRAIGVPVIIFVALVSTVLENFGAYGTDNLLVPVFVALALSSIV